MVLKPEEKDKSVRRSLQQEGGTKVLSDFTRLDALVHESWSHARYKEKSI